MSVSTTGVAETAAEGRLGGYTAVVVEGKASCTW